MDSLMVLAKPCPSLLTMLKLYMVVWWPVVGWWPTNGEGAFRCFLYLSPDVIVDSPMFSSLQLM